MAAKDDPLEIALAHFQAGKSIRECEKITGVNRGKIERQVKARMLIKGSACQLIADKARVDADFVTLSEPLKDVVTVEVSKINKFKERRDSIADKVFDRIELSIASCDDTVVKSLADALDRVCITTEIAPRFSNVIAINNTNAQQNKPIFMTRVI
jgi:hypothetical protein